MRSQVGKALRSQFEMRLRGAYPSFKKMSLSLPGGSRLYEWAVSEELALYIMLQVGDRHDRFNLSIGFGEPGRMPRPTSPDSYEEAASAPGIFRLGWIVRKPYRDIWWNIDPLASSSGKLLMEGKLVGRQLPPEEESVAAIPALLDAAFGELAAYAVPFFKDVTRRRGVELKLPATTAATLEGA
jgi:hypothetical protein